MVKHFLIGAALFVIIVLLLLLAIKPQTTIVTTPTPPIKIEPTVVGPTTPKALEPERGEPTPKKIEVEPLPPGVPLEKVRPKFIEFFVNEIRAPDSINYEGSYIPIKKDRLKTFAGTFGPYYEDPTPHIRVMLCSELYKVSAAPSCEIVPLMYREQYVSFARGYQFDEYIGGQAVKDYIAYFVVLSGDAEIGRSNIALIRTIRS